MDVLTRAIEILRAGWRKHQFCDTSLLNSTGDTIVPYVPQCYCAAGAILVAISEVEGIVEYSRALARAKELFEVRWWDVDLFQPNDKATNVEDVISLLKELYCEPCITTDD